VPVELFFDVLPESPAPVKPPVAPVLLILLMASASVSMMNKKHVELNSLKRRDIQPDELAVKSDLPQLKDVPFFNRRAAKFSKFKELTISNPKSEAL
jgi:hypothetical protein